MKPAEVERNEFFKFAQLRRSDVIWDFGCGNGRYIYPVRKVYATDIKKGKAPGCEIDKFLALCVMHYIQEKDVILDMAYNQLKEGGHIVLIEPNPINPFFYCLYFWRWITQSKCERRWNKEKYMSTKIELILMLSRAGFKNIEVKKYAWFPSKFRWLRLNRLLNNMPLLGCMNAFNWIRGEK